MTDLTPEDEALISRAREGLSPGPDDHTRIKRRLLIQIAAGTAAATAALSTSAEAAVVTTGAGIFSVLAKVVAVGVLSAAVVGGGIVATRQPAHVAVPAAPRAPLVATATPPAIPPSETLPVPTPATSAPAVQPAVADRPRPSLAAPPPPAEPAPSPATVPGSLAAGRAEAELLARADNALKAGDPLRALQLVDQHAANFPGGVLFEEREAERAMVLCALDRPGSEAAAQSFLRDHPRSPLAPRVRKACASPP